MPEDIYPLVACIKKDPRYPIAAYAFVKESLRYAADVLEMGMDVADDTDLGEECVPIPQAEQHLTGQQLCEAIRQFSLNQFGFMAKVVMNEWGIYSTADYGNIVYNMIDAGLMKKSEHDRQSDFDAVYDFESEFDHGFEIALNLPRPIH